MNRLLRGNCVRGAAVLAIAFVASGGPSGLGCASPFDPQSLVNTLRILAINADHPYSHPGDKVTFKMTFIDARPDDANVPVEIVWLGGCFNPDGGQYYGCYPQLADLFSGLGSGQLPPGGSFAAGPGVDTFELSIPDDIVSSLPEPAYGPKYGTAFVFYLACAGQVKPVQQAGDTAAGSFPLGCFDDAGNELGPEAFVPGYTQIYVFDDGRENENPPVNGLMYDDTTQSADATLTAKVCAIGIDERRKSGCSARDEFMECDVHDIDLDVPDDVAEDDPESKDINGNTLKEVVWVSYFATGGTFQGDTKLINDATKGIQSDRAAQWVAPDTPGTYQIWAVARDNRGGSTVLTQFVNVTSE